MGLILSNLQQLLHLHAAVFDSGRAVIDSKQWRKRILKSKQKADRGNKFNEWMYTVIKRSSSFDTL